MKVNRSNETFVRPQDDEHSIFLVGPTPRAEGVKSFRPEALDILTDLRYNGLVYVPEPFASDRRIQIKWETLGLTYATVIACWLCRDFDPQNYMPALTSNTEFGEWFKDDKFVYGRPEGTPHTGYQDERYLYRNSTITGLEPALGFKFGTLPHTTLRSMLEAATEGNFS